MLPNKGWRTYEAVLKLVGERRLTSAIEQLEFLGSLGLVSLPEAALTTSGSQYFHARWIDDDEEAARCVLREAVLTNCPEAAAIAQLLAKRDEVPRAIAETVLRSQGYCDGLTDRRLGGLLALMHSAGIISYSKSKASFTVLAVEAAPSAGPPRHAFITPDRPYSNKKALAAVLEESHGFIYWFDKHWLPAGLDFIEEAADASQLSEIRVLSLGLDENKTRKATRAYRDLARELAARGITFEWRLVPAAAVKDVHDRWIISEARARNVPNLNAILSGQHSELVVTENAAELQAMFERLWDQAPRRQFGARGSLSDAA